MKRTLLFLIPLVFLAFQVNAQKDDVIPNPGYENWSDEYEEPESWATPNPYTSLVSLKCVFKESEDVYEGNFSARLISIFVLTFKVPGILTLGSVSVNLMTTEASIVGGIPWTSKPDMLRGYYKYTPADGDTCAVIAYFTEFIPLKGKRDTLGIGMFYGGDAVSEWTEFSMNINYFNDKTPDSMNIVVSSSANIFDPVPGSTMLVDALSFEVAGIGLDILPEVKVNVYPNPASERLTFEFEKKIEQGDLIIYNVDGQAVRSVEVDQQKMTLDAGGLPSGTYYFHVLEGYRRVSSGSFVISE